MQLLTASAVDEAFLGITDPFGLALRYEPVAPGQAPRLVGIAFASQTEVWHVPLAYAEGQNADMAIRHTLYPVLAHRPVFVDDGPDAVAVMEFATGGAVRLPVVGDVVTAQTLLGVPATPIAASYTKLHAQADEAVLGAVARYALETGAALQGQLSTLRGAYQLECQVATWLRAAALRGYPWTDGSRVVPTWTTVQSSGSWRITSKQPSLSNVARADRVKVAADPYSRWVSLMWPALDLYTLARLSGDPFLHVIAPNPWARLAFLWDVPEAQAQAIFQGIIATGTNPIHLATRLKADLEWATHKLAQFAEQAPRWLRWASEAEDQPVLTTPFGRTLTVEPRNAHAMAVMEASAENLKVVLSLLVREAQLRGPVATITTPIPLYTGVFYQLDVHVPVEVHLSHVFRLAAIAGLPEPEMSAGPTWGTLTRIDGTFGQTAADLGLPGRVPVACPVCQEVAQDPVTLREHLVDVHEWSVEQVGEFEAAQIVP